ncbi:MAG: delta-60 repeat domain-containing protein, partial [Pyrinomonadaceae bacterium]
MKKIALLILITLFTVSAFAADGDLDGTFGTGGKVVTGNFFDEGGRDVAIQPDGKIIAVGAKTSNFNSGNMAAVRYNADGSLDTNFGSGGVFVLPLAAPEYAAGKAIAVEVLPDGKILLGGSGRTLISINQIYLIIRLNANGTLDTTFGTNGRAIYDFGNNNAYGGFAAMVFDAARNKIYVSATRAIDINNAIYGYDITRFNDNGTLDTSFNGTGSQTFRIGDSLGTFTHLFDIALQTDGKIIATGGIQYIRSSDNQSIESFGTARINVDGSLDSSFGTNGIVITDFPNSGSNILYSAVARTVSLLPDGRIFIGGSGGTGSGGSLRDFYFAARLNINGSLDSSFGTGGKIRAEAVPIADSVITPGGKIIITGIKNGIFGVARLNSNGTIDTTFGTNGVVQTAFRVGTSIQENPFAVALQPDGKIVVAGGENNPNTSGPGQDYTLLARYNGTAVSVNNPALRVADFDGDGKS